MGGGGGASAGGRYEEKGGGQQVGSFFAEATDNDKIEAIYGNYGFWSWLRYWWLDTENYVTFMLMDKGYYDYDYETVKTSPVTVPHEQSEERTQRMMDRFGFGKVKSIKKPLTPAEVQSEIMKELQTEKKQT